MKKIFSSFKIKDFVINLMICLAYPIIKTIISDNKALVLSDTTYILSMMFIIGGVFNIMIRRGSFDALTYTAQRTISKNKELSFESYKKDKQKEREDSFNYLLLVGITVLIISIITSYFA